MWKGVVLCAGLVFSQRWLECCVTEPTMETIRLNQKQEKMFRFELQGVLLDFSHSGVHNSQAAADVVTEKNVFFFLYQCSFTESSR